jgi:hypothetical protein
MAPEGLAERAVAMPGVPQQERAAARRSEQEELNC